MFRVLIVAQESDRIAELASGFSRNGFTCSVMADGEKALGWLVDESPDLVLMDMNNSSAAGWVGGHFFSRAGLSKVPPLLALVPRGGLNGLAGDSAIDDFVVEPFEIEEVIARARRLLGKAGNVDSGEVIKCGHLTIDTASCEVCLNGNLVDMTFREYELLRFLAANTGRVFTREVLLNRVWGYDYFGGDRTVDVHIRRLRSKIEDTGCTFIETVRNVGYKFKRNIQLTP